MQAAAAQPVLRLENMLLLQHPHPLTPALILPDRPLALQVGGMRYSFNPNLPEFSRLVTAQLLPTDDGSPVPLAGYDGSILLLTADYNANGGDNYTMFEDAPLVYDTSTLLASILSDYVTFASPIDIAAQGRIINCAQNATDALCSAAPAPAAAPSSAAAAAGWGGLAQLVAAAVVAVALAA